MVVKNERRKGNDRIHGEQRGREGEQGNWGDELVIAIKSKKLEIARA